MNTATTSPLAVFKPTSNQSSSFDDSVAYNYVKDCQREVLVPGYPVLFGCVDPKGRELGMRCWAVVERITLATEADRANVPRWMSGTIRLVGSRTVEYIAYGMPQRGGKDFGGSWIRIAGDSLEEVQAELLKRVERSRKAAIRKFPTPARPVAA
jgi:hypothetical protein